MRCERCKKDFPHRTGRFCGTCLPVDSLPSPGGAVAGRKVLAVVGGTTNAVHEKDYKVIPGRSNLLLTSLSLPSGTDVTAVILEWERKEGT